MELAPMAKADEKIPDTIKRSPPKAQRTWKKTLESAEAQYGKGERASRTAYAQLKQSFEKVGDHWESKDGSGPSDSRSAQKSTKAKRQGKGKTYGGVDVRGSTKEELENKANKLGIRGRSRMSKDELGEAINKANQHKTAQSRKTDKQMK